MKQRIYLSNLRSVASILLLMLSGIASYAQADEASRRRNFNAENGIAMREFDPVSYFKGDRPLKGSSKFYANHKGITYYFANQANLDEFKNSPDKYEPAYGGWCAYTVSQTGERVKINPVAYKIIGGRLHLFYNFNSDNRLLKWNKGDEKKLRIAANRNWAAGMH